MNARVILEALFQLGRHPSDVYISWFRHGFVEAVTVSARALGVGTQAQQLKLLLLTRFAALRTTSHALSSGGQMNSR